MFSASPKSENGGIRPQSITRCSRESFTPELETLPSETTLEYSYELNEEVIDVEDISEDEESESDSDSADDDLCSKTGTKLKQTINQSDENVKGEEEDAINEDNSTDRKQISSVNSAESELEVKIRKGLEKVKKFDEILSEKMEEEKEAKRSRRAVEKEFQSQVAKLIQEKGADKVWGSQQLLYLCASSDRGDECSSDVIEPIFHTQIDDEYYSEKTRQNESLSPENPNSKGNEGKSEKKGKKGKNFVKRNIQLAAQAQEIVPFTEEERKRVDELLADDSDLLMVENPFSAPATIDGGYHFSEEDLNNLENINAKLKELIPVDEFTLAIGDPCLDEVEKLDESQCTNGFETFSTKTGEVEIPQGKCGEHVLQEGHDEREVEYRLRNIEDKLAQLQCSGDAEYSLDPDLLRKLLDVDSRLTSDSISICESLRSKSALYNDIDSVITGSEAGSDLDYASIQLDLSMN